MLKLVYMQKYLQSRSNQKAFEASGMELFMAEVSGWKLLTVDVEGFLLDVMWFLDLPLSKYLCFWSFSYIYHSLLRSSRAFDDIPSTLRCGSFSEKTSKKSTCAVMIRIIITFANQMFL